MYDTDDHKANYLTNKMLKNLTTSSMMLLSSSSVTTRKRKSQIFNDSCSVCEYPDGGDNLSCQNCQQLSTTTTTRTAAFDGYHGHKPLEYCLMCRQNDCLNNECCHEYTSTTNQRNNLPISLNHQNYHQQNLDPNQNDHPSRTDNAAAAAENVDKEDDDGIGDHQQHYQNCHQLMSNDGRDETTNCSCRCSNQNRTSEMFILNENNNSKLNSVNNISNNNMKKSGNQIQQISPSTIMEISMWKLVKLRWNNLKLKKSHTLRTFNKSSPNNCYLNNHLSSVTFNLIRLLCLLYLVNFLLFSAICGAVTMDSTNRARLQPRTKGEICNSRDIRNYPSNLEGLRNCSVIEGFLTINLMEATSSDFENASFPLLTEITEFLFVFRIRGLKSLGTLFPNLSIIRGKQLFEGFALVLYENFNLVDIGLKSLTLIKRGAVRIEKNPELCFIDTVNWTEIIDAKEGNYFSENKDPRDCPSCPVGNQSLSFNREPNCWNFKYNQKICPPECKKNCNDKYECCNENCSAGCASHNVNLCISCKDFVDKEDECQKDCPKYKYKYSDRSCISSDECHKKGNYENNTNIPAAIYNDTCVPHCPDGHERDKLHNCIKCPGGFCYKECDGASVDSLADARKFIGCSFIGSRGLIINLRQGGKHLMDELETAFKSVRVIDTYLRVVRSFSLTSLSFFKNLHTINGNGIKDSGNYALYVLENNNLQHIWGKDRSVNITNGRVFFHFNEKLCYKDIVNLLNNMTDNSAFNDTEVPKSSNGNRGSCDNKLLNTEVTTINSKGAVIKITNPIPYQDERVLIAYQYYYIEAPFRNVTKHDYRNPCGSEGWSVDDDTKRSTSHPFTRLKPYTQYAYYVKTETTADNINGESEIDYFTTLTDTPMSIRNFRVIYRNLSSELLIKWLPPARPNGNITLYKIKAKLEHVDPIIKLPYCIKSYKRDELYKGSSYDVKGGGNYKNNDNDGSNCRDCYCEKESHHGVKQQSSYYDYENSIVFEDAIQNFVFVKIVKNTNETDIKNEIFDDDEPTRFKRAPPDFELFGNISIGTTTISSSLPADLFPDKLNLRNTTYDPMEKISTWDYTKKFYTYFYVEVNSSVSELLLTNLKYFSKYSITVVACHDGEIHKNCSDPALREAETNRFEGADNVTDVEAVLDSTTNRTYNVKITWTPPVEPNGIVLKYNIQYYKVGESIRDKCVSTSDFIKNNDTTMNMTTSLMKPFVILQDLPTGNYEIRVQAITQAGEGFYSDPPFDIYVPPTKMSWQSITAICVALLVLLILVIILVWYVRKRYLVPPPDLKLFTSVNPEYISMQYTPDEWELPREKIVQHRELGQGSFGMVYQGTVILNRTTDVIPCAIKTVNENATDRERINFLNEASVMKEFNTHHVVKLLGVVSRGQPTLVVMELMKQGDLKAYLRKHRPDAENIKEGEPPPQPPSLKQLLHMALEICDGMAYLSAKKFVHRDLAARNCMVADDLTVKIGDFGMTRDIYETDYYRKGTKGLLPVRWMSPESLKDGVFSSASDVFSFGVVLWEMATLASQPYQGLSNDQVLRYVIEGGIMDSPQNVNCPDQFYTLMSKCWQFKPNARPSFIDIIQYLMDTTEGGADDAFKSVSFYHSPAGQEAVEQLHPTTDIDDATVPLRMGEYDYKSSVEDTLSHGHRDSNLVQDEPPHSPYSIGSLILISSTPGENQRYSPSSHPKSSFLAAAVQSEKQKPSQQQQQQPQQQQFKHFPTGISYALPSVSTAGTGGDQSVRTVPTMSDFLNESPQIKPGLRTTIVEKAPGPLRRLGRGIWNLRKFRANRNNNNEPNRDENSAGGGIRSGNGTGNGSNGTATKDDGNNKLGAGGNGSTGDKNGQGSSSKLFLSSLTPSHTSQNPNYQILNESNVSGGGSTAIFNNPNPSGPIKIRSRRKNNPSGSTAKAVSNSQRNSNSSFSNQFDDIESQKNPNPNNDEQNQPPQQQQQCKDDKYIKPSSYLSIKDDKLLSKDSGSGTVVQITPLPSWKPPTTPIQQQQQQQPQPPQTLQPQTPYQLKEQWLKQHLAAGGNAGDQPPPNGFIGRGGGGGGSTSSNDDLTISNIGGKKSQLLPQQQKQHQYWIGRKSPSKSTISSRSKQPIDRSYTQDSSSPLLEMSTFETSKDFEEEDEDENEGTSGGNGNIGQQRTPTSTTKLKQLNEEKIFKQ